MGLHISKTTAVAVGTGLAATYAGLAIGDIPHTYMHKAIEGAGVPGTPAGQSPTYFHDKYYGGVAALLFAGSFVGGLAAVGVGLKVRSGYPLLGPAVAAAGAGYLAGNLFQLLTGTFEPDPQHPGRHRPIDIFPQPRVKTTF